MKREEFIEKIDRVIHNNEGCGHYFDEYTCPEIYENLGNKALQYYQKEFALLKGFHWIEDIVFKNIGGCIRGEYDSDYYCLRAICLEWFKIWSLEEKHYLEY